MLRRRLSSRSKIRTLASSLAVSTLLTGLAPAPRGFEHQVEQDLQRSCIGGGGFDDELLDHRFALGDLAAPAVIGDRRRLVQQRRQVFRTRRAPSRVACAAVADNRPSFRSACCPLVVTGT